MKGQKLSDQIRRAIRSCALTRYRIAVEAGIAESSLSRFLSGEHGLTTETLDKIADVLRLEVVCHGPRKDLVDRFGTRRRRR